MQKYDYFEKNRYDFSELINQIEEKDILDEVIYYEDEYFEIEFYVSEQVEKSDVIELLKDFGQLDNQVQYDCEKESQLSNIGKENYAFVVGWVNIKNSHEVEIGYFGACVNTCFNQKFIKKSNIWKMYN